MDGQPHTDYGKLCEQVANLRERMIAVEVQMKADAEALQIMATEYARRLTDLNGEAGRIAKIASESVSKDRFEEKIAEARNLINSELHTIRVAISAMENWKSWVIGATATAAIAAGMLAKLFR